MCLAASAPVSAFQAGQRLGFFFLLFFGVFFETGGYILAYAPFMIHCNHQALF